MDKKNNAVLEEVKKRIPKGNGGNEDIGLKIQIEIKDDNNVEELQAEAKKRSEEMHNSASDYYKLLKRLRMLEGISGIELLPQAKELGQLKAEKKRIDQRLSLQSQAIRDQFAINVLIAEINDCAPTQDADVLDFFFFLLNGGFLDERRLLRIHQRLQKPTPICPSVIFFYDDNGKKHDFAYIPSEMEGRKGQVSGTDKVLVASLRELSKRYFSFKEAQKEAEAKKDNEKFEAIKSQIATSERDIREILDGRPGTYIFFLPSRMEGEKKFGSDGVGIVRVKNLNSQNEKEFWVVEAVDGVGSLKCLANNSGHWVALSALRHYSKHNEVPDRVPENRREISLLLCRKIYAAYCASKRQVVEDVPEKTK